MHLRLSGNAVQKCVLYVYLEPLIYVDTFICFAFLKLLLSSFCCPADTFSSHIKGYFFLAICLFVYVAFAGIFSTNPSPFDLLAIRVRQANSLGELVHEHGSDLMLIAPQICKKCKREKSEKITNCATATAIGTASAGCERNNKHFDVYIFANN